MDIDTIMATADPAASITGAERAEARRIARHSRPVRRLRGIRMAITGGLAVALLGGGINAATASSGPFVGATGSVSGTTTGESSAVVADVGAGGIGTSCSFSVIDVSVYEEGLSRVISVQVTENDDAEGVIEYSVDDTDGAITVSSCKALY